MTGANESPLTQKVLGIPWNIHLDEISVDLDSVESFLKSLTKRTKRNLLQLIARIYDPIGLLGPYVIKLKILFQSAWRLGVPWDEELPNELLSVWQETCGSLHHLKEVVVPRYVSGVLHPIYQEIHIFADASTKAYGCAAYLRSISGTQLVAVRFLCAKSRVSPLKEDGPTDITIPRLELTAALIAARLCKAEKWKQYVTNRVREIHRRARVDQWRYCPGNENPADLIIRGINGKQLMKATLWLNGPGWLQESSNNWPLQDFESEKLILVNKVEAASQVSDTNNLLESLLSLVDYSDWKKLLRVTAYALRFIEHTRTRKRRESIHLITEELEKAERYWIKYVQREIYSDEMQALSSGGEQLHDFVSGKGITWKYIVERAPWWGGFWDRLVRSVKACLKMTIGRTTLDEEDLRTLLTKVEGVVNSRPLTYVSEDPLDLNPLSPVHFLIGGPSFLISPEAEIRGSNDIRRAWTERLKCINFFGSDGKASISINYDPPTIIREVFHRTSKRETSFKFMIRLSRDNIGSWRWLRKCIRAGITELELAKYVLRTES